MRGRKFITMVLLWLTAVFYLPKGRSWCQKKNIGVNHKDMKNYLRLMGVVCLLPVMYRTEATPWDSSEAIFFTS